MASFSSLSPEGKSLVKYLVQVGHSLGASDKEILAAISTAAVENSYSNKLTGGPAVGWRQEEPSYGSVQERLQLTRSVPAFYMETKKALASNPNLTSGQLAQAVQRSAYPLRYSEHATEASSIFQEVSGQKPSQSGVGGVLEFVNPVTNVKEIIKSGEEINSKTGKAAGAITGGISAFSKVGETFAHWIEEPLVPVKFLGGAILVYLGVRTLTTRTGGGATVSGESRRTVAHLAELGTVGAVASHHARRSGGKVKAQVRKPTKAAA
jgi:hypothetical protein